MSWRIGVDIGGTFIDFCALDESTRELHTLKVLTTPAEPGREVMDGIALLQQRYGMDPAEVTAFVHGTTVGINTVIQRKGADLALLTTAGFEDVIELARLRMPDMHGLFCARPNPLIPRDRIFGIPGRVMSDGSVQDAGERRRSSQRRRCGTRTWCGGRHRRVHQCLPQPGAGGGGRGKSCGRQRPICSCSPPPKSGR